MKKIILLMLLATPVMAQTITLVFTQEQLDAIKFRVDQRNADIAKRNQEILELNASRTPMSTNKQGVIEYNRPLLQTNKFITVDEYISFVGQQCTNYFNRILRDFVDKKQENDILSSIVVSNKSVFIPTNRVETVIERLKDAEFKQKFIDKIKNTKSVDVK